MQEHKTNLKKWVLTTAIGSESRMQKSEPQYCQLKSEIGWSNRAGVARM